MKKLKKFNKLYNKLIFESSEKEQQLSNLIRNCEQFFKQYIFPLAEKCQVIAQKNRENVFRISGNINNVFDFFNNFKADNKFDENNNLQLLFPTVTYGDIKHFYNNGEYNKYFNRTFSEGNQLIDAGNNIQTTRTTNDQTQLKIEGKWYNLYFNLEKDINVPDFNVPKILRKCSPIELRKALQIFINNLNINANESFICVEFSIDCNKFINYRNNVESISITYSDNDGNILDVADTMNNEDKIEKLSDNFIKPSDDASLICDTKKIIRKTKKLDYNIKNKTKTKKVK